MGDIVRHYYERKCRAELREGPPAFLASRPVSIAALLAEEREASAEAFAATRGGGFGASRAHHAAAASHGAARLVSPAHMQVLGPTGHPAFLLGPRQRPAVWQAVGEIVTASSGSVVNGVYCGPASALTLQGGLG